jgi:EmrB/QacA subfamily drug resistance transporter
VIDPAPDQGHPRKWWILVAVSFGMFMALLDVTIVNIAIPAIIADLGSSVSEVSWVISAYSLTLAVLFLSMGRISDKFGQKRVFIGIGLVVFTVFSLLCGLAPNIEWLIIFRIGQGVGGAALAPISLAILLGAFPRRQHGMAVGIWGAMGSVAGVLGPTLGGILIQYLSWHWIFFMNVPVGLVAIAMAMVFIPERKLGHAAQGIDVPGILISAFGLFCLVLALIQGNSWGWTSSRILGLFAVAVISYPLFMWWELRTPSPMFDFRLLRIRSFTAANSAMFFIGAALGGSMFLLVLFLVNVLQYSELKAAIAIIPMPLTGLIVAPLVGRFVDKTGPRIPGVVGALFFVVGLVLLAQLNGTSTVWDATWRTIFLGAGIGFAMPTFSSAAMGSLPPRVAGVGSGALNTLRQVGFSLGLAIVVAIFSHTLVTQTRTATAESVKYVQSQTQIPASARAAISAGIVKSAAEAQGGGGDGGNGDPLAGAPPAAPGSAMAQQQAELRAAISQIYRDDIADAFTWPFYAAALAALFAVFPALLTGRRLGADAGHEEMTRSERSADRTLAAEEAAGVASAPGSAP